MRKHLYVLIAFLLSACAMRGQSFLSVEEGKIRAFLKNDSTVISIPLVNFADHPVKAELALSWVNSDATESNAIVRNIVIQTGQSSAETALAIVHSSIWERLRYTITPDRTDARAFMPTTGIVALAHIASHVFEVRASYAGSSRPGSPITVHAQAIHPVTRQPALGVEWTATLSLRNRDDIPPVKVLNHPEGFADFTFDLPTASKDDSEGEGKIEVTAKLGDFEQDVSITLQPNAHPSGSLQSDKPIYQPGQTLHLRGLVKDPQGRAAPGAKVTLRIDDQDSERVHTIELVASRFGIVQDDWKIPASASLGVYQIEVVAEDDDDYRVVQHAVRISRYELPTFSVTAKSDRPAYLLDQQARVTITGAYLFGKPVPKGRVKIVRNNEPVWNRKTRTSESSDEIAAEGIAADDGTFTATIDLKTDQEKPNNYEWQRFKDLHFSAYYTDVTSGRTEQRRFDLRITREPIHVYFIRSEGGGSLPAAFYVFTSYADGRPAATSVEIQFHGQTRNLQTNRYGVGKTFLQNVDAAGDPGLVIKAVDQSGLSGHWREPYWSAGVALLRIDSAHTIHKTGQPVTLQITSAPEAPAEQAVMIHAICDDRTVVTRIVRLTNHHGEVTFPYQPEFHRTVIFTAWNGANSDGALRNKVRGSRAVIFPDVSDLRVSASAERASYKPGDKATLRMQVTGADGKPVEAAFGLAVVDQAVLERARTESDFGHRPWFDCAFCRDEGETEIGGIRLNDLYHLKPGFVVTPEFDLVAEAIVAKSSALVVSESSETFAEAPYFKFVQHQVEQLKTALDEYYAKTLEFPEDLASFFRILGRQWSDLLDPWGKPYRAEFSAQQANQVVSLYSSGPDKQMGTSDDYVAGTISRPYFNLLRHLIAQILKKQQDYPATEDELVRLLSDNGLILHSLRDPWDTPYRAHVRTYGQGRTIVITSAGPDRKFETRDDFALANFSGTYFSRETAEIANAVQQAARPPQSIEEFRSSLKAAGIDISSYRDPWGKPYRLTSGASSRHADRINAATVRVFGGAPVSKTEIIPVTQDFITISLRSDGPDGEEDTGDDFDIARFPILLNEKSAEPSAQSHGPAVAAAGQGRGAASGTVTDTSGGVVPKAKVTLFDAAHAAYEAVTGEDGVFHFPSLTVGVYSLRVEASGFMVYRMSEIPVMAGKTTDIGIELQVGMTNDSVIVAAQMSSLQTEAAEVSQLTAAVTGTPRVRDYFPETLLWLPEILTDTAGRARADVTLADSVTNWKLAAVASTLDGRTAQVESEFRTFQPFFLDFNPPPVLTEGDQVELPVTIRNYLDKAQKVAVALQPNEWSMVKGESSKQVAVGANSSVNVAYLVQATHSADKAPQRIIASAAGNRDAIEKSARVHPDGQQVMQTFGDFVSGNTSLGVTIPAAAIPTATRGELRIYPNIASLLLESASAILETPHGCAEQTISAGYANLTAWKFAHSQGIDNPQIEKRALVNVRLAVEALGAFQNADGGVRYWTASEPDIAVSAYALNFLVEASTVVQVDNDVMLNLIQWLKSQQAKDGRWLSTRTHSGAEDRNTLLLTATVVRALAAAQKAGLNVPGSVFAGAYHHLAQFTDRIDEPYMLANFILAALDSGDESLLGTAVARLTAIAREERGGVYWDLQTNSPFYGWGTAGRYETSGLAVSALSAWRVRHPESATNLDSAIRRGLAFLSRGRDAAGCWYSTQSTLRAMHAIADASAALGNAKGKGGALEIRSNGRAVKSITLPTDPKATDPILMDVSAFLSPGENQISLVPASGGVPSAIVRLTSTHWLPWTQTKVRSSPELRFDVRFDRLAANAREPIRCTVNAERIGFRGYGMMLAEIGLPPGAEVDRSSLESVLEIGSSGVNHYEILPDRVVLYLWPKAGGAAFDFFLSARIPLTAKSAASTLYDYYNPEASAELAPFRWVVKGVDVK